MQKLPYPINRGESALCVAVCLSYAGAAGVGLGLRQPAALGVFGLALAAASITLYVLMRKRMGFTGLRPLFFLRGLATRSIWASILILRGHSPWEPRA